MWEHLKAYGYAPGNYTGQCFTCCKMFTDLDKRAIRCKACAEKMHAEATPPAQPADSTPSNKE